MRTHNSLGCCLFYPSLRGQDKTVKARLSLNCLEFDVIEIRIMETLPKPKGGDEPWAPMHFIR